MRMDSIDGKTSGYCLESSVFEPQRRQDYFPSPHPSRTTDSGNPQPLLKGILGSYPVVKRLQRRVENPHLSSADVKN